MIAPPAFVPARQLYGLRGLGMTVDEARQILARGDAPRDVLIQAREIYYSWYNQQPNVIAARTGLSVEQVQQMISAGVAPDQIEGPQQYMARATELQEGAFPQYLFEQCDPFDAACIERNAQRGRANMALRAERNRQINYNICMANRLLRGEPTSLCAEYATPVSIPGAPGQLVYLTQEEIDRIASQAARDLERRLQQQPGSGSNTAGSGSGSAGSGNTGTQTYRPQVQLENASRPGQPLRAGDTFRARVTGAQPGAAVEVEAYQDGRSLGRTRYGLADAQGNFNLTGTIGREHVGHWREIWHIGSAAVTIEFDVQPAPSPTHNITDLTPGGGGSTTPGRTEPGGTSNLLGSMPQWVWIVAAALFVWRILQK